MSFLRRLAAAGPPFLLINASMWLRLDRSVPGAPDGFLDPVLAPAFVRSRPIRQVPKCGAGQIRLDQIADGAGLCPPARGPDALGRLTGMPHGIPSIR